MPSRWFAPALAALALAACRVPVDPVDPAGPDDATGGGRWSPRRNSPGPGLGRIEAGVDLDGRPVGALAPGQTGTLAVVFASWCGHCRHEMRVLDVYRQRHPEVRVLGINYKAHEEYDNRGSSSAVRAYVAGEAPWLRVVPADDAMWASLGSPPKVPTVYVFDRAGALVRAFDRRVDPIPELEDLEAVTPR